MAVDYRVLVFKPSPASSGGFGVGDLICELENAKNVGWAKYLNDIGEAYVTLDQGDPKAKLLRSWMPHAHVFILRGTDVVWRGLLSEHEAINRDVVFYAYGYESRLYSLLTGWNQSWTEKQIDTIATALWTRAKTDLTYSPLGFVTTGTIEAPVTTSGGSTAIVLPSYKAYYKRILFALKELVAISASDTTNICYFEIAHGTTLSDKSATFNLWKNKTSTRDRMLWEYGGLVYDYADRYAPLLARNDLFGVGSGAHNLLFRHQQSKAAGAIGFEAVGRYQEPIYLSWVRDQDELVRVTKLRAARALRTNPDLVLRLLPESQAPIGATGAGHALGDRIPVRIDDGSTQVDDSSMLLVGEQVSVSRGVERVFPMLSTSAGV